MSFGTRIRDIRKARGLTIKEVAEKSGIAYSLVSNMENDKANPSLMTIYALAKTLNTSLESIFAEDKSVAAGPLVRVEDRVLFRDSKGLKSYLLCNQQYESFETHFSVLEPGVSTKNSPDLHNKPGSKYEFAYIISGKVEFSIDGKEYVANPGDSVCYESASSHYVRNLSEKPSEILWLMMR
nr:helix-turn-helix transcriptional regulator [Lachnospiraceae bacterium]